MTRNKELVKLVKLLVESSVKGGAWDGPLSIGTNQRLALWDVTCLPARLVWNLMEVVLKKYQVLFAGGNVKKSGREEQSIVKLSRAGTV